MIAERVVTSGSSQNIIRHAKMAFRFQLPVGNEGLFAFSEANTNNKCPEGNTNCQKAKNSRKDFKFTHKHPSLYKRREAQPRRLSTSL